MLPRQGRPTDTCRAIDCQARQEPAASAAWPSRRTTGSNGWSVSNVTSAPAAPTRSVTRTSCRSAPGHLLRKDQPAPRFTGSCTNAAGLTHSGGAAHHQAGQVGAGGRGHQPQPVLHSVGVRVPTPWLHDDRHVCRVSPPGNAHRARARSASAPTPSLAAEWSPRTTPETPAPASANLAVHLPVGRLPAAHRQRHRPPDRHRHQHLQGRQHRAGQVPAEQGLDGTIITPATASLSAAHPG